MSLETRMRTMALNRARAKADSEPAGGACQRRARRKPTALQAMLTFAGLRLTVPCTVADMSSSGARIAFPAEIQRQLGDMEHLPRRCTLVLKADRVKVEAEIQWQKAGKVGLRFAAPAKPLASARD